MTHSPASDRPAAPTRPQVEHTRWSPGLIGFYASCAGVALGATFASAGPLLLGSTSALVFGVALSAVSCVTCYFSLVAARKRPE
jgi:hypothetical protein